MREVFYVSDTMLKQLRKIPVRRTGLRRLRNFGVKAPFSMGEISVGLGEAVTDGHLTMDAALREFENGDIQVKWYEDDSVKAGDWIQFDVEMNSAIVSVDEKHLALTGGRDRLALFWFPFSDGDRRLVRLLLQGNPDEVVGSQLPASPLDESASTSDLLFQILPAVGPDGRSLQRKRIHLLSVVELEVQLEADIEVTAIPLSGYARVKSSLSVDNVSCMPGWERYRYVIANPLYIERSSG